MKALNRSALALAVLLTAAAARADEEPIPLDKLPAAVTKAVKAKFPGATLKEAAKEVEDGVTTYEVSLDDKGTAVDVVLKPDGEVVVVETAIAASDLPEPVARAVKAKYPEAKIKKAERLEEKGETTYEVLLETAPGKSTEVVLAKDGKILKTE